MDDLRSAISALLSSVEENINDLSDSELSDIESLLSQSVSVLSSQSAPKPQIPSGAESLWVLAGGNPRAFTSYLRTFPNPQFNSLYQNVGQRNNVINQLSNRITLPGGESAAGVPKAELNSSNIYGFQYDPRDNKLRVRFNNGGVYEYDNVPSFVYKMFSRGAIPAKTTGQNQWGAWWVGKNPSLGASFHELIRDHFPYARVA